MRGGGTNFSFILDFYFFFNEGIMPPGNIFCSGSEYVSFTGCSVLGGDLSFR